MTDSVLSAVVVVLYESQDQINIGGVVRAMKHTREQTALERLTRVASSMTG